jgi:endonuclease YncB( thermonuclease family)
MRGNRRKWQKRRPASARTTLGDRGFRTVTAIMCASAFGVIWFWDSDPSVSASDDPGTFACTAPYIHDGDNIRCQETGRGRLYGIDAPEMPGACRPGRRCTPGDPFASRDHLRRLAASGEVRCRKIETDHYGRAILQCWVGQTNLSCAQVEAGQAVKRYGDLKCP